MIVTRGGNLFFLKMMNNRRIHAYAQTAAKIAGSATRMYRAYRSVQRSAKGKTISKARGLPAPSIKNYRTSRRPAANNGKSAGFFKGGKRIKWKKNRRVKILRNGTYETLEAAGVVSATNCRYIGHASMPRLRIIKVLCQAIVKAIAMKLSGDFNDFTQTYGTPDDTFVLNYKTTQDPSAGLVVHTYTIVAADTWQVVADDLYNLFTQLDYDNLQIISFEYRPTGAGSWGTYTYLYLANAGITIDSKSALKIQNRSKNADGVGDNAEDVDNTPIHGKVYEGNGSGLQYIVKNSSQPCQPLVADPWGVISGQDDGDLPKEPPLAESLIRVKKTAKAHLEPGHIKTSVLSHFKTYGLNNLLNMMSTSLLPAGAGPNLYMLSSAGTYRCYAFEKMINTSEVADSITIGFEHNIRIGASLKLKNHSITNEVFVSKFY